MTDGPSEQQRHGGAMSAIALTLGIPAFAGTTRRFLFVTTP
jgi:hypothetical protein